MEKVKLSRIQYRNLKNMNRSQIEEFVSKVYDEGFQEGRKVAEPRVKVSDIATAVMEIKDIDTQAAAEIISAINELYAKK